MWHDTNFEVAWPRAVDNFYHHYPRFAENRIQNLTHIACIIIVSIQKWSFFRHCYCYIPLSVPGVVGGHERCGGHNESQCEWPGFAHEPPLPHHIPHSPRHGRRHSFSVCVTQSQWRFPTLSPLPLAVVFVVSFKILSVFLCITIYTLWMWDITSHCLYYYYYTET